MKINSQTVMQNHVARLAVLIAFGAALIVGFAFKQGVIGHRLSLADVHDACPGAGMLLVDHDKTLSIDGAGEGSPLDAMGASDSAIRCVMNAVQMPPDVRARVENTTAIQGSQDASWGRFGAVWMFNSTDGLSLTLVQR